MAELEEPDCETVEKIRGWIRGWLANPAILPVDLAGKNYLKLFFVYDDMKKPKSCMKRKTNGMSSPTFTITMTTM